MREIKFRVWNNNTKRYESKGFLTSSSEINNTYVLRGVMEFEHNEDDYNDDGENVIFEQYTGLKDKNGKEIYEGDIVRWDDMSNGKKWRVAVVELFPALQFRIIKIDCNFIQSAQEGKIFKFGNFIYTDTHNHLDIIGNIHKNPELLTDKTNKNEQI